MSVVLPLNDGPYRVTPSRMASNLWMFSASCSCNLWLFSSSCTCNLRICSSCSCNLSSNLAISSSEDCNLCSRSRFRATRSSETAEQEDAATILCRFRGGEDELLAPPSSSLARFLFLPTPLPTMIHIPEVQTTLL
jgi:hypothetical protein